VRIAATGTWHRDQHGLQCGRAEQNAAGGKHEKRQFRSVSLGHGRRGWCCTFANGTRYAESGLPESRTPANAGFVFWTRSLRGPALAPTLFAALLASAIGFRHCCRIVTKSTAKCGAFNPRFFASWRACSVAFEGAVMRIIILAAVLAVSSALGGCFHFHTSQVYSAPQALPPLK
jgi:hypothetical protein